VTYTRYRIDTINSPDDEHMAARNMYRIEINIHEIELRVKFLIYKNYATLKLDVDAFCAVIMQSDCKVISLETVIT
jgi:hypothetical protein